MQSIPHLEPTDIEITIDRLRMYIALLKGLEVCSLWAITNDNDERRQRLYRNSMVEGVAVRVLKLRESRLQINAPHQPEIAMKAIVGHLKDVFKLPLTTYFRPNRIQNFLRFLPVFPVCKRFYFHATEGVSEEELKFVKDNVVVELRAYFYTSS
ncbi:hypothetical protein CRE_22491 [Caenorhabditis remanei]|uniref:DUF38 domain-containing protein n=1 Tax=Caenorhabditis remanei TaxID=31234 RepID=E3MU13_CAERE|nr:hypothetical protein CRE_22489 [Caenorhabditis remanei]EFP09050.1 hypothetical protein CRE_22491 [Caenorhabditis remanei]